MPACYSCLEGLLICEAQIITTRGLHWQYKHNPTGEPLIKLAIDKKAIYVILLTLLRFSADILDISNWLVAIGDYDAALVRAVFMKYACITMDVESDITSTRPEIELFSDEEKLENFGRLCNEKSIPLTAFLVTKLLDQAPNLIEKACSVLPIKFEVHSHSHDQSQPDSEREIDASVGQYSRFFGNPPKGYRAPNGLITPGGLKRLADRGFSYDSSIFPSIRFDEYGYNHLSCPIRPYVYQTPGEILEVPMGVVKGVRLVISLSFVKLFGPGFYKVLIGIFGLPDVVTLLSHPYDFTLPSHLHRIKGWKRYAHARNAREAAHCFVTIVDYLRSKGYQFVYIDDMIEALDRSALPRIDAQS